MVTSFQRVARKVYRATGYLPIIRHCAVKAGGWADKILNRRLGFADRDERLEYFCGITSMRALPMPVQPTAAIRKIEQMEVRAVKTNQYYRGILLEGWEQVENALKIYENGIPKGSKATATDQFSTAAQAGNFGVALMLRRWEILSGETGSFVDKILAEARPALEKGDVWNRRYDYDGPGTFHKTTVEIRRVTPGTEMFALHINAAYVGDKPEKNLSKHLGVLRALTGSYVIIETVPHSGTEFVFDFEELMRRLDSTLSTEWLRGAEIVEDLVAEHDYFGVGTGREIIIYLDGDFCVTIRPGMVGRTIGRGMGGDESGETFDGWRSDGGKLFGPLLERSYSDEEEREIPTVVITVRNALSDSYKGKSIYDAAKQQAAIDLTKRIADALMS